MEKGKVEIDETSSEEEYFYPKKSADVPFVSILSTEKTLESSAHRIRLGEERDVLHAHHTSRLSALKESLESQGQLFIQEHLEPLSRRRHFLERQDRVISLQLKWALLLRDKTIPQYEDCRAGYEREVRELEETFVLAYDDYLSQRLARDTEQERKARVEGFKAMLEVEKEKSWRPFFSEDQDLESYCVESEMMLSSCMERLLEVESEQVQKIGEFEALQTFGSKKLREAVESGDASMTTGKIQDDVEMFCTACSDGDIQTVQSCLQKKKSVGLGNGAKKKSMMTLVTSFNAAGVTGVHLAAKNGHSKVLQAIFELIGSKKSVEVLRVLDEYHSMPPCCWAVGNVTDSKGCEEVLKVMSEIGQKESKADEKSETQWGLSHLSYGKNALHFACRFGNFAAVVALVEHYGFSVDEPEQKTLRTSLHISASKGFLGITSYLVSCGGNPLALNKAGESAVYEAYLAKRAPVALLFSRKGYILSAVEQEKLKKLFKSDPDGLKLLKLPHEDAMRRLRSN